MTKKNIAFLCLLLAVLLPVSAQEQIPEEPEDDYIGIVAYTEGEQIFALNAGAIFPLFNLAPFHAEGDPLIGSLESLKVGITGSLKWGAFVSDNFLLGVELCGMFAGTENRSLSMIPISFITAYYFIAYPFEFPIYVNTGFSLNTLDEYFRVTPSIKPGAGAYWKINGEWALGLNLEYWFMPELYFSDEYSEQSRIANLLQLSLSAVYHF